MANNKQFIEISRKIAAGESLSRDDGLLLMECDDIFLLGTLANLIREKKNGNYKRLKQKNKNLKRKVS